MMSPKMSDGLSCWSQSGPGSSRRKPTTVRILAFEQAFNGAGEAGVVDGLVHQRAEQEGRGDALSGAVGDWPPVRLVREGPRPLTLVPMVSRAVGELGLDLVVVHVAVGVDQGVPGHRGIAGEQGLHGEGGVPEAAVVVAVHAGAAGVGEEVVGQLAQVMPHALAIGLDEVPDEEVEDLVHRADADGVAGVVLVAVVVEHVGEGALAQPPRDHLLEPQEQSVDRLHQRRVQRVLIRRRDLAPRRRPVDGRVGLGVDLSAKVEDEGVCGQARPGAVHPGHGQVDLPRA